LGEATGAQLAIRRLAHASKRCVFWRGRRKSQLRVTVQFCGSVTPDGDLLRPHANGCPFAFAPNKIAKQFLSHRPALSTIARRTGQGGAGQGQGGSEAI
jgi:hypothetical protein